MTTRITPAVLGWANENTGDTNLRLYALDKGNNPRWDNSTGAGGRTIERALEPAEGDRYLVIRLGDRFVPEETKIAVEAAIAAVLGALL